MMIAVSRCPGKITFRAGYGGIVSYGLPIGGCAPAQKPLIFRGFPVMPFGEFF